MGAIEIPLASERGRIAILAQQNRSLHEVAELEVLEAATAGPGRLLVAQRYASSIPIRQRLFVC
ncbi:hypothetical protein J2Y48_003999 [Mycoplana sp. BE70]|uniref:hypothetical protein n=1 Tax=Mycoplana sp. BE70 TaxID=2817775 RepID=UPI00285FD2EE|nr:hypothetical protein [Mycoplana sp. BE70]MDR6758691.1 hypothetical protein [Mycoplana sp. BE70]